MDNNCECQQKYVDYKEYDELGDKIKAIAKTTIEFKKIRINFDKVAVCKEYVKTVTIEDFENTEIISYMIKRESVVNSIYQIFNFNRYDGLIKPGECLKLKIKYAPQTPYQKHLDTFVLVTSSCKLLKIIVTGETKGPILRTSVKRIDFFKTPSSTKCKKTFEIKNISDVPAEFNFDLNKEGGNFYVEPSKGTIQGLGHIYVEAYFVPSEYGLFSKNLFCLTWCDAPLIVDLFGVHVQHDTSFLKSANFKNYPFPFEETVGYDAYFQDTNNNSIDRIFPTSLSRLYIDFGRMLKENEENSNVQEACITNFTNDTIRVKWPKDDVFSVVPRSAEILYNDSVSFDYRFNPKQNNVLYNKILTAQIEWTSYHTSPEKDKEATSNIPITATIRLQGHSFPEGESWISKILTDPGTVILPPCLPGYTSNTNFKICVIGHLPVMYRIVPAKKSHVVMKPMVGVIYGYTVVAVQLYTEKEHKKEVFDEQWYIVLNGRDEKRIPLCVKGEVGVPRVLIGYKNNIRFESVQPGCETFVVVLLKNISSFEIRFQFDTVGYDCIELEPMFGFLTSDEETTVKCKYTGNKCIPNKITLKCKLQTLQKIDEFIGEPFDHLFYIYTKCVYSQLCATPNQHDFGKVQWGTFLETEFHLFNFGESIIYFQLNITFHSYNRCVMKIKPKLGEVHPGDKLKIIPRLRATTIGNHKIGISYGIRKNSTAKEMMTDDLIRVYEIRYNCAFPKLQIEEIVEHNFGPLFGKTHFWKYLEILKLNRILRTIKNDETKTILLNLPDFEVNPAEYYITLLVKNITTFDMTVRLKRKQMCPCPLKEIPGHINVRKKAFDCPHREMLTMELSDTKFYKKTSQLLTIRVKYTVPEETQMSYILELGDNRTIQFIFTIIAIPEDDAYISLYSKIERNIPLKHISVCRRVAPIQTIWLYNNTKMSIPYKLDETEFIAICRKDGFDILKCLNPEGEVLPYSSLPLMIKFHPIEIKIYEIIAKLILGDRMIEFPIKGTGHIKGLGDPFSHRMPMSSKKTNNFPVTLSVDYISIDSLPVWNIVERVIFIRNVSKDKIMQYTWGEVIIDGVLEITTETKSGMLKPKESRPILIKIKSFNEACITNILLVCKMLDYVQFVLYRKSLELYNKRQEQVEAEFTVTEEGSYHEPNEIVVADLPEVLTISVSINVNIIHTKDRDDYLNLMEQFKITPQDTLSVNVLNIIKACFPFSKHLKGKEDRTLSNAKADDKDRIQIILEDLITDFTFGKSFEEMFKTSDKQVPPLYKQFTVRLVNDRGKADNEKFLLRRKQLVKKVLSRPNLTVVATTIKELIKSTVIEIFKLGMENSTEMEIDKEVEKILQICTTLELDNSCGKD